MKIGFVGAGKVGTNLARYFERSGLMISGFFVRTDPSTDFPNFEIFSTMEELIQASEIIFLTVQDDAIRGVAEQIAGLDVPLSGRSFAHTSGSCSLDELAALAARGASCFTLHPLQTFRSRNIDMGLMEAMHCAVERGDSMHLDALLTSMGNPIHVIATPDKVRYHLAASVISNLTTALVDLGFELMESIGVSRDESRKAYASLLSGTIGNIAEVGPRAALTGPVSRGDAETVRRHLAAIPDSDRQIYRLLARRSVAMASDRLSLPQTQALLEALGKDEENV